MTDTIVDWLSTYALHSTVLLCAVYALERLRILVEVDVRESAWRIAALAPIITAALQVALMIAKPHDTSSSVMQSADESISHTALPASSSTLWPDSASGPIPRTTLPAVERPDSLMGLEASAPLQIPLPMPKQIVAIVWLLGGGLALGALAWQFSALRRRVDAFALCRDGGVVAEALELAARAKVRIDAVKQFEGTSTALVVPPATLCIPTWAVGDLDPAHRRAMIAHEVAHLARRDPWWRLVHRAVARILFFQPMNWVALKRLDELSEFSCDEWAAKAADRVALMECLIACGERIVARQPALAASMARHRSTLIERIQILFTQAPRRRLRVYLARGSLLALCFGALGLPMLAFEETAVAAPQIESASSAASHSHSWSLDDARSQGVQIVRRSKFGGLWGPRVTTLQVNLEGATLGARIEGDVKFAVTEDSVAAIEGSLVIEERQGPTLSRIEVHESQGGEVQHQFQVDRQSRAFEPEGRQFMARTVPIILRESTTDADARIARLLARGAAAVLDETALIRGGYPRRIYLSTLAGLAHLDAAQLTRAIELTAAIHSDYERRMALTALLMTQSVDNVQVTSVLALVATMKSDFEQRMVLTELLKQWRHRDPVEPAAVAAWFKAIDSIASDFEARTVIVALAEKNSLDPALIEVALRSTANISSDFEARMALSALARHLSHVPTLAIAYAEATDIIASDFEKRMALGRLIESVELDVSSFKAVLTATGDIGSNFECQKVLHALLARLPADKEVIELYRNASSRCDAA